MTLGILVGLVAYAICACCSNLAWKIVWGFISAAAFSAVKVGYDKLKERVVMLEMELLIEKERGNE